ncbi:MAG TPA: hypothetical protein VH912_07545 [Streptosporangiaceae bacterium]
MVISPDDLTLAALVAWVVTALLGANLLVRGRAYRLWARLSHGHLQGQLPGHPRPPKTRAVLMVLHVMMAAGGLTLWLAYEILDLDLLIYVCAGLLVLVSLIGIFVVDRWRHVPGRHALPTPRYAPGFPIWSATVHVMAGTATIMLVVLTLLAHLQE